jgi:hypothetical protein
MHNFVVIKRIHDTFFSYVNPMLTLFNDILINYIRYLIFGILHRKTSCHALDISAVVIARIGLVRLALLLSDTVN